METEKGNVGLLIVLSGASGVGKDVVMKRTMERRPDINRIVTYCADRGPRPGEVDGVDYHFVSTEVFDEMVVRGEFIEYNRTPGIIKGTTRSNLEEVLDGKKTIWRIDPDRAAEVKKYLSNRGLESLVPLSLTIYLGVPTIRELWRRINERASNESKEKRINRLKFDWETWLKYKDNFDYVIINESGKLEETVEKILEIVERRTARI